MTIICDGCGARYAIDDERVRGPFSVRCRRCSGTITSGSPEAGLALQAQEPAAATLLTAARHEHSVLFSMANLGALASSRRATALESGLFEIQAHAGRSQQLEPAEDDPLAGISVYAPPLLLPTRRPPRARWLVPAALVLGGALLLSTITLAVMLLARPPTQVRMAEVGASSTPKVMRAAVAPRTPPAAVKVAEPRVEPPGQPVTPRRRPTRPAGRRTAPHAARSTSALAPIPPPAPASVPEDPLAKLVEKAIAGDGQQVAPVGAARASRPGGSALPESLSKEQIVAGMRGVQPQVQACHDRYRVAGVASVRVRIASNGRVRSATVTGSLAGTPSARCIESAVHRASFPRFREGPLTIPEYPLILK